MSWSTGFFAWGALGLAYGIPLYPIKISPVARQCPVSSWGGYAPSLRKARLHRRLWASECEPRTEE
eukprot:3894287-Pyramimonas_sp.AAC.1